MATPPESIQVGKWYLMETGHIRTVQRVLPDGRVQYRYRSAANQKARWREGIQDRRGFAFLVEREIPCDWTLEADEA